MDEALETVNNFLANGGVFAGIVSQEEGVLIVRFGQGENQPVASCTLTVVNVADKDISTVSA